MKLLLLFTTILAASSLAQTVELHPLTVHWMNDGARKDLAKWEQAHKGDQANVFAIRPSLIRFWIDGKDYEVGARSDGVVVWRPYKP